MIIAKKSYIDLYSDKTVYIEMLCHREIIENSSDELNKNIFRDENHRCVFAIEIDKSCTSCGTRNVSQVYIFDKQGNRGQPFSDLMVNGDIFLIE